MTLYGILATFEEHGLAVRAVLADRVVRWQRGAHSHHVVCRRCGTVVEVDPEPFQRLADELARCHGLQVEVRHLVLRGLCAACAAGHRADHDQP